MSSTPETAGMGVSLPVPATIPTPILNEVLKHKAEHPEGYLPVKDVTTRPSDDGLGIYREMTFVPTGAFIKENIYNDGVGEERFVVVGDVMEVVNKITDDGAGNRTLEFFKRNAATKERVAWDAPFTVVHDGVRNVLAAAQRLADGHPLEWTGPAAAEESDALTGLVDLGYHVPIPADLTNTVVFEVLKHKIYHPEAYLPVTDVKTFPSEDGMGVYREMTVRSGAVMKENVYHDGASEVRFVLLGEGAEHVNKIGEDGAGNRVLEFFKRNTSTGERVPWAAPKTVINSAILKIFDAARSLHSGVPLSQ